MALLLATENNNYSKMKKSSYDFGESGINNLKNFELILSKILQKGWLCRILD